MIKYSSKEIKGYNSSKIAKSEKNDCFVRAMAAATDTDYDTSHEFVKKTFNRKLSVSDIIISIFPKPQ